MGFDNECILNIQSLAGEYFCPVCRLLVYPNEAMQSQCTHLFCKPCLTYTVSTTRACPYDGYLVTEADSKPLIESNKALAETIGKIAVHCLYHRSGCTWQGPLSDCTSHCAGCGFGSSPVVCNRCGIQIVHRQVQEHAQSCPGQQLQTQHAQGSQDAGADPTSQATSSQTATMPPSGPELNQQVQSNPQTQAAAPTAMATHEQWYQQQQQQYQQYYQQYPGYDPYQQQHVQQYYPYQSQPVQTYPQQQQVPGQHQSQMYTQPQAQPSAQPLPQAHVPPQPHPHVPTTVPTQHQNQVQLNAQQLHPQLQGQAQPAPYGQPQPLPHPQPHPHHPAPVPPNQQPYPHSQLHPQHLNQSSQLQLQAQTQHQSQLQAQPHLPSQPNLPPSAVVQHPPSHAVTGHQSYMQPQPHQQVHPMQMPPQHPHPVQNQFPHQQPPQIHPPVSHALSASQGQVPHALPAQQLPTHRTAQPVHQRPIVQPIQQPLPQHYGQPFPGLQGSFGLQQQPVQAQLRPQVATLSPQQSSHIYPNVPHNNVGRPTIPNQGIQSQPFPQTQGAVQARPMQIFPDQSVSQSNLYMQQSLPDRSLAERDAETSSPGTEKKNANGSVGLISDRNSKSVGDKPNDDTGVKDNPESMETGEGQSIVKRIVNEASKDGETVEAVGQKDFRTVATDNSLLEGEEIQDKKEAPETALIAGKSSEIVPLSSIVVADSNHSNVKSEGPIPDKGSEVVPLVSGVNDYRGLGPSDQVQGEGFVHPFHSVTFPDQGRNHGQPMHYGLPPQQRPGNTMFQSMPPPGPPQHTQLPGHPPSQLKPQGFGHFPPPGPPLGSFHATPPQGNYEQVHIPPSHVGVGPPQQRPTNPMEAEIYPNQRPGYFDGRQPNQLPPGPLDRGPLGHTDAMRMNGPPRLDSSVTHSFTDQRFDPTRRVIDRGGFEEDLKQFPRPSNLDIDKFGPTFSSSRVADRGPHGFPLDPPPRYSYDDGLKLDVRRSEFGRSHSDFVGPIPGFDRRHMDRLARRSPVRDYPPPHGYTGRLLDDLDGRESRRLIPSDPIGNSFHDNRFPAFSSHMRRGDFDGPDSHFRRGDYLGPRNLRMGEPGGFEGFTGHGRIGDRAGPGSYPPHLPMGEMFGGGHRPTHPRFGEPGFRSSYSLRDYPNDGGLHAGEMESFDNTRKRKLASSGWCRICKVDCETVEGLDLHSQTREHQKVAMDIVISIKQQNLKRPKLASNDHAPLEDGTDKSRNGSFEDQEGKHKIERDLQHG